MAAAVLAIGAAVPVVSDSIGLILRHARARELSKMLEGVGLLVVAAVLLYGILVYLAARIGHLQRLRTTASDERAEPITDHGALERASVVMLIPTYREDPDVVLRALESAALQPHPNRRVVLLIDDTFTTPPENGLTDVRALPGHVEALLRPPRDRCGTALVAFDARVAAGHVDLAAETAHLADACREAAAWFETQAERPVADAGTVSFFRDVTFRTPAARWRGEARRWESGPTPSSIGALRAVYLRLLATFTVEVTSFERKQFANLSHASNKAMNINTYLGLLGGAYRHEKRDVGTVLGSCSLADADLVVPDADFALILDADTIVSPDYTPKLLRHFAASGGESLAVAQSPYSTFPGNRGILQRIAGAQTDVQYLIHQGLTYYDATFWVGANALVRVAALRELAVSDVERGFTIQKFISDRTLIEDTESSIDLVSRGWRLHNHLERLAFSMTPADFGALVIQRQRWANGGLLIVPKLFGYLRRRRPLPAAFTEAVMRLHYLVALGPVSLALLIALGVAWDDRLQTGSLAGTGLVYYLMYGRDLHLLGYRWYDVVRVVALNVILIPVNLAGLMSSILQAVTGRRQRFLRTPKVHGRTAIPTRLVVAELVLLGLWCAQSGFSMIAGKPFAAMFMLTHTVLAAYAIGIFIGFPTATTVQK